MLRVSTLDLSSCYLRVRLAAAAALLLCAGLIGGCAMNPLANRAAAFSTAATAAATQTLNAYDQVNHAYSDGQMAVLVANYDRKGFDQDKLHPFLPEKDLAVRRKVLNGLKDYAALLAEISGDKPVAEFEAQAAASADALRRLDSNSIKVLKVSDEQRNLAVTAVTAMGAILIEHQRAKALPAILEKMNGPIQNICSILRDDIGTLDSAGLADAVHRSFDRQIEAQKDFIDQHEKSMTAIEKRAEIETLPKLVLAQRQADEALASTRDTLADLAAAHAALTATKGEKDSPAFRLKLNQLIENARTVAGYYQSASTSK